MPVYLLHGFRWPRPLVRIHIILQNLDDAAAEWLVAPATTKTMLKNFNQLYPESIKYLPNLRFVEQYDPNNDEGGQPYAYVADICTEVKLGIDIDEFRGKGVASDQWAAIMELRDKIAPEEKVGWYVVVCGDEERCAPSPVHAGSTRDYLPNGLRSDSETSSTPQSTPASSERPTSPKEESGFRKFFGSGVFGRRKSRGVADEPLPASREQAPSLPQTPSRPATTFKAPQLPVSAT